MFRMFFFKNKQHVLVQQSKWFYNVTETIVISRKKLNFEIFLLNGSASENEIRIVTQQLFFNVSRVPTISAGNSKFRPTDGALSNFYKLLDPKI